MVNEHQRGRGQERRQFKRIPLRLWMQYKCYQQGKVSAQFENITENIGAGGLGITAGQLWQRGQVFLVTLCLPPKEKRIRVLTTSAYLGKENVPIHVCSRVAWCAQAGPKAYKLGLQFYELDRYSRERWREFLHDCHLDQNLSSRSA